MWKLTECDGVLGTWPKRSLTAFLLDVIPSTGSVRDVYVIDLDGARGLSPLAANIMMDSVV
jgi:hypothetical protein